MAVKGGVNHIMLQVRSIALSEEFYCDLLGLERVGIRSGMHFYSSGLYNHELALLENPYFNKADARQSGLMHIAFNVDSKLALSDLYQRLIATGYAVSERVNHIISHSFYTRDKDDYLIELTTDCARQEWEQIHSPFKNDYSLDI